MMTDLAVRTGSELAIDHDQSSWTDRQVAALAQLGMVNKQGQLPPPADLAVYFHQCQRTGLDPFAKQIYMIERFQNGRVQWTIQTGIDGFRLVARRAVDRAHETLGYEDTLWCGPDGHWVDVWIPDTPPVAAKVVVLRNGQRYPAVAKFSEYAGTKKEGGLTNMWATKGALMLAKCAEALALRKAFPQDLSGLYTSDEMAQADNPRTATQTPQSRPQSIRDVVAQEQKAVDAEALRTPEQAKRMKELLDELQLTDPVEALAFIAGIVGHAVKSTRDLTVDECDAVNEALENGLADDPEQDASPAEPSVEDWPEVKEPPR